MPDQGHSAGRQKKSTSGLSQRNQYIVIGVLGVVFAGVLGYRLVGSDEASAAPVATKPEQPLGESITLPPPGPPPPDEPEMPVPGKHLARDPFVVSAELQKILDERERNDNEAGPAGDPDGPDPKIIKKQAQALILKGIMGNASGGRTAFISNRPVRAGSTIRGFTVVEVRERSVLLKKDQIEVELKLQAVSQDDQNGDL